MPEEQDFSSYDKFFNTEKPVDQEGEESPFSHYNKFFGVMPEPSEIPGMIAGRPKIPKQKRIPLPEEIRADGTMKGPGYFGKIIRPDKDISTELSIGTTDINGKEMEIPLIVPTLTQDEIKYLMANNKPTPAIVAKAISHAKMRFAQGKSPFAIEGEQRPQPKFNVGKLKEAAESLGLGGEPFGTSPNAPWIPKPDAQAKGEQLIAAIGGAAEGLAQEPPKTPTEFAMSAFPFAPVGEAALNLGAGLGGMVAGKGAEAVNIVSDVIKGKAPSMAAAREAGQKVTEAVQKAAGSVLPSSRLGQAITTTAAAPFTAIMKGVQSVGEIMGFDREQMAGVLSAAELALLFEGGRYLKTPLREARYDLFYRKIDTIIDKLDQAGWPKDQTASLRGVMIRLDPRGLSEEAKTYKAAKKYEAPTPPGMRITEEGTVAAPPKIEAPAPEAPAPAPGAVKITVTPRPDGSTEIIIPAQKPVAEVPGKAPIAPVPAPPQAPAEVVATPPPEAPAAKPEITVKSAEEIEKPIPKLEELPAEQTPAPSPAKEKAKEPWQMTLDEFRENPKGVEAFGRPASFQKHNVGPKAQQINNRIDYAHRAAVEEAVMAGENVPDEIINIYPDIPHFKKPIPVTITKEPWEVTRKNYIESQPKTTYQGKDTSTYGAGVAHSNSVKEALESGKEIPAEVLKDYPDLVKRFAPSEEVLKPPEGSVTEPQKVLYRKITPEGTPPAKPAEQAKSDIGVPTPEEISARGILDAQGLRGAREVYEFARDDRGHGDEYMASAAGPVAERMFGTLDPDSMPSNARSGIRFMAEVQREAERMRLEDDADSSKPAEQAPAAPPKVDARAEFDKAELRAKEDFLAEQAAPPKPKATTPEDAIRMAHESLVAQGADPATAKPGVIYSALSKSYDGFAGLGPGMEKMAESVRKYAKEGELAEVITPADQKILDDIDALYNAGKTPAEFSPVQKAALKKAGKLEELPPQKVAPLPEDEFSKALHDVEKDIKGEDPDIGLSVKKVGGPGTPPITPAGAPKTKPFPKVGSRKKMPYENPTLEARHKSNHGIHDIPIAVRAKDAAVRFKNRWTRIYMDLPSTPQFSPAIDILKRLEKQKSVQAEMAARGIRGITAESDKFAHDIFERVIWLRDMNREVERGHDLPNGWTPEEVAKELKRYEDIVSKKPAVQRAIENRNKVIGALRKTYIEKMEKAGQDVADKFTYGDDYFHHMVQDYYKGQQLYGTGQKMKAPKGRGFMKKREGTTIDVNTDYIQAEFAVMSQMLYDIQVCDAWEQLRKIYDISDKVKEFAKDPSQKNLFPGAIAPAKGGAFEDWHDAIPDTHTTYQFDAGNNFFFAHTIPERIAQEALSNLLGDVVEVPVDKIRKVLAMGGPKVEVVFPKELVKTLNNLTNSKNNNIIANGWKSVTRQVKRWLLASPGKIVKYNIRNMTGDAESVFLGNPSAFRKIPQAVADLYKTVILKKELPPVFAEWFKRGGIESTLTSQETMVELKNAKVFKRLYDENKLDLNPIKQYWRIAKVGTNFRESILRYAAFLDYLDQLEKGGGKPRNYGASRPEMINALTTNFDKAYALSNDLLGAYDKISVYGQNLRENWYPFWSWKELNFKRYVQFTRNAWNNPTVAKKAGAKFRAAAYGAVRLGHFAIKAVALWTIVNAIWNNWIHHDEEASLSDKIRDRIHIILGKDKDGNIIYFNNIGTLGDFLQWFGMDQLEGPLYDAVTGKKTFWQIAGEMAKAPINTFVGGFNPVIKGGFELLAKRSFFPDAFHPTMIRDRGEYIAQMAGLLDIYKRVAGKPTKPFMGTLSEYAIYKADPEEQAYRDVQDWKREYVQKYGRNEGGGDPGPKSNALYYMKQAMKYGDKKAVLKYFDTYLGYAAVEARETKKDVKDISKEFVKGIRESLGSLHPLAGMKKSIKDAFLSTLDERKKEKLALAIKYYNDTLIGTTKVDFEEMRKGWLEKQKENE